MKLLPSAAALICAVVLNGCGAKVHPQSAQAEVEMRLSDEQAVCHFDSVARRLGLSADSVRSAQARGTMFAFRLIGDDLEIVAYNPDGGSTWDLSAIDMSERRDNRERVLETFAAFRNAIVEPPAAACAGPARARA